MLNRLLMGAAGLIAGTLVAAPAVLGLSGNSSFRRDIQVPIPSGAHSVSFGTPTPSGSGSGSDRPGHDVLSSDAPDDHGGLRGSDDTSSAGRGGHDDGSLHDIGGDHSGDRGGDDNGGGDNSGSGSDDSGHGGHG